MIRRAFEVGGLLVNGHRSSAALCTLQEKKLFAILAHAYLNVPYYRRLFDSIGLRPGEIRSVEDLRKVPPSSKSDLRAANGLVAENIAGDALAGTTSGSTGHPFEVWLTPREIATRRAVDLRAVIGAGIGPFDRIAAISARPDTRASLRQRAFFRTDRVSALEPLETQLDRLRALRPTVLWAAPSTVRALLQVTDYRLIELCGIRKLVTTAEAVDEHLRHEIERTSGIRWHNFYGAVETGRIAWQCGHEEGLHLNSDHVVLEIESCGESRTDIEHGFGSVLVTTLNQYAMPFIRYRLGDLCAFDEDALCTCGNRLPLIKAPIGRSDDVVLLPSGRYVSPRSLTPLIREHRGIRAFQIIQEHFGKLTILLELGANPAIDLEPRIKQQILQQLGERIEVEARVVERIERTTEKLVDFVSRLPHQRKELRSSTSLP